MKNLKKVLAMVLAFACTFTMFAGAKVFEDVPAGSDYSEAITMLSDLGIIKGKTETTYAPDETITREEACTLIARLLTGEQDVVGFENAQNFTDTKYSWAKSAIGYCVVNGIVVGDGNGKFRPMDKITDAEFVTMVVRAMGYETPDMKQNYPHSYLSAAMAKGLLDNVNMVATSDALRGENAQIIYNALFADYARGAMNNNQISGTTNQVYPTLAESVWNLSKARVGNWDGKTDEKPYLDESNCEAHTWVIIGEAPDKDNALLAYPIDDDDSVKLYDSGDKSDKRYAPYKFKYEGDASTIEALKGYKVELYGEGSHGKPTWNSKDKTFVYSDNWTIKAIKTTKGQTATDYNASMADKKDKDGTVTVGETSISLGNAGGNAEKVTSDAEVPTVATFMGKELNGIKVNGGGSAEEAMNIRNGNQYKLMDWDGDGEADWIVVDQANYYKVESATSKRVTVTSMKSNKDMESNVSSETETWKLDSNESVGKTQGNVNTNIKYEVPEGLKEGDILEVTYKVTGEKNDMLITATATVIDAENQKLEKVGSRDGLTLTFGDEELKVAQNANKGNVIEPANPQTYKGFNGEELGTEFALWQDRNGFIVYSDYATDVSDYMMVLDTGDGNSSSTNNRKLAAVDMKTQDNSVKKDVQVADDLRVLKADGKPMTGAYDEDTRSFDESQVVGNVFKYWTNEDGIITKMQAVIDVNTTASTTGKETYEYNPDTYVLSDNGYKADLEDARVIFAVKPHTNVSIANNGYIEANGDNLKVNADNVLALEADDLASIGANKDIKPAKLDGTSLSGTGNAATWLDGLNTAHDLAFIASLDNNKDAVGAVLGVNDFTKFGAQNVKVGLVTNVSERNGGIVEIDVASGGKVETFSTAEKSKFSDVVKVFNGSTDVGVAGVDSLIKDNENKIFDGESLSTVINEGGMYAEITTDADGKLLRVVFMDDVAGEENYIKGHYYEVTRNVVTNVKDNKSIYFQKNTKDDPALYAGEGKLYSVDYLNQDYGAFASDANYYEIDAEPTRHDRDYSNSNRMTVNAGFDNLRLGDITTIEAGDINYQPIHNTTNNDAYAVADIAKKMGGDVVAVYSFKGDLDEVANTDVVLVKGATTVQAGASLTVNFTDYAGNANNKTVSSVKVFDGDKDVTADYFTVSNVSNTGATVTAKGNAPVGSKFTIKAMKNDKEAYAGGLTIEITHAAKFDVTKLGFALNEGGQWKDNNDELVLMTGKMSTIPVAVTGTEAAQTQKLTNGVTGLGAENFKVKVSDKYVEIDHVESPEAGIYHIVLKNDITTSQSVTVELVQTGNINSITAGAEKVEDTTPTVENGQGQVGAPATIDFGKLNASNEFDSDDQKIGNGDKSFDVQIKDKNDHLVSGLTKADFKVFKNQNAFSGTVAETVVDGTYRITFQNTLSTSDKITVKVGDAVGELVVSSSPGTAENNAVSSIVFAGLNPDGEGVASDKAILEVSEDKTSTSFVIGVAGTKRQALSNAPMDTPVSNLDPSKFTVVINGESVKPAVENLGKGYYKLTVQQDLSNTSFSVKVDGQLAGESAAPDKTVNAGEAEIISTVTLTSTVSQEDLTKTVANYRSHIDERSALEDAIALKEFGTAIAVEKGEFVETIKSFGVTDDDFVALRQSNEAFKDEYWKNDARIDRDEKVKKGSSYEVSTLETSENTTTFIAPKNSQGAITVDVYKTAEADSGSANTEIDTGVKIGTIVIDFDTKGKKNPIASVLDIEVNELWNAETKSEFECEWGDKWSAVDADLNIATISKSDADEIAKISESDAVYVIQENDALNHMYFGDTEFGGIDAGNFIDEGVKTKKYESLAKYLELPTFPVRNNDKAGTVTLKIYSAPTGTAENQLDDNSELIGLVNISYTADVATSAEDANGYATLR